MNFSGFIIVGIYFHRDTLCFSNDGLKVDLITISSMKGITDSEEEHLNNLFPDKTKKRALKFTEKKVLIVLRFHCCKWFSV